MLLDLGDWENLPRIGYILNNSCAYRQFISTHTHTTKKCAGNMLVFQTGLNLTLILLFRRASPAPCYIIVKVPHSSSSRLYTSVNNSDEL